METMIVTVVISPQVKKFLVALLIWRPAIVAKAITPTASIPNSIQENLFAVLFFAR
jgi:hypothetical protein